MCNLTIDPNMPRSGLYFHRMAEGHWYPARGEDLQHVLQSPVPPQFCTILGILEEPDFGMPNDIRYAGPLYFDFDSERIEDAITDANATLKELASLGVPAESIRAYLTGGRGVHLEIPMACFTNAVDGIKGLPLIYREMARRLQQESLDLNVYSGRKGRMWRTPNVQRPNGKFKVPIEASTLATMTAEEYAELTSMPRPFPPLAPPVLATGLMTLFSKAQTFVMQQLAKKRASSRTNATLQARFKGKMPPSVACIMQGKVQACAGFNRVALQLAVTANAVGMTEDAFIGACGGFIARHQSDSGRYASAEVRERELRKLYLYVQEGAGYSFSAGAIRALLPKGFNAADLRGL